jgi:hypothetical protein
MLLVPFVKSKPGRVSTFMRFSIPMLACKLLKGPLFFVAQVFERFREDVRYLKFQCELRRNFLATCYEANVPRKYFLSNFTH